MSKNKNNVQTAIKKRYVKCPAKLLRFPIRDTSKILWLLIFDNKESRDDSIRYMAKALGKSKDTILSCIAELKDHNMIRALNPPERQVGSVKKQINEYFILGSDEWKEYPVMAEEPSVAHESADSPKESVNAEAPDTKPNSGIDEMKRMVEDYKEGKLS